MGAWLLFMDHQGGGGLPTPSPVAIPIVLLVQQVAGG